MTCVIAEPCGDVDVEFFDELGSPGGAARKCLTERGHPLVAALPPQVRGGGA